MTTSLVNKEAIFREIYKNHLERQDYLDKLPKDVDIFVVDNEYASNMYMERTMLIRLIFGDFSPSIEWFLDEWIEGFEVGVNGVFTEIYSIDEYIDWLKLNEGFI